MIFKAPSNSNFYDAKSFSKVTEHKFKPVSHNPCITPLELYKFQTFFSLQSISLYGAKGSSHTFLLLQKTACW